MSTALDEEKEVRASKASEPGRLHASGRLSGLLPSDKQFPLVSNCLWELFCVAPDGCPIARMCFKSKSERGTCYPRLHANEIEK